MHDIYLKKKKRKNQERKEMEWNGMEWIKNELAPLMVRCGLKIAHTKPPVWLFYPHFGHNGTECLYASRSDMPNNVEAKIDKRF